MIGRVKYLVCVAAVCLASIHAFAQGNGCITDQQGKTRCSLPDSSCATNRRGEVVCTAVGGGMMNDQSGELLCGPGYCVADQRGQVVCSSLSRGAAAIDQSGNAVCAGSCIPGKAELCMRPAKNSR